MPKLTTKKFEARDRSYSFRSDISVNSAGWFVFTIPEETYAVANNLAREDSWNVSVSKLTKNYTIQTESQRHGEEFLAALIKAFLAADVVRELIICYRYDAHVRYVKTAAGEIFPNAHFVSNYAVEDRGEWKGHTHSNFTKTILSIGLGARVWESITTKRASGDIVKYERTWGPNGDHFGVGTWLEKLNQFESSFAPDEYGVKQMPYTEEAAQFFYEGMVGLCRLADRMADLLGDSEKLAMAIEQRTGFLLGSGTEPETREENHG